MTSQAWYFFVNEQWHGPVKERKFRAAVLGGDLAPDSKVKSEFGDVMTISEVFPDLLRDVDPTESPLFTSGFRDAIAEGNSEAVEEGTDYFKVVRTIAHVIAGIAALDCIVIIGTAMSGGISSSVAGALVGAHVVIGSFFWALLIAICRVGDVLVCQLSQLRRIDNRTTNH